MKFKKHISFIIAFFLLVSNYGIAFNVHFCQGSIASISSVFSNEEVCEMSVQALEKKCCAKKVKKHKSCCNDKVVNLKAKSDHLILKSFSFNSDFIFLIEQWNPIVYYSILSFKEKQITTYFCDANAPPFFKLYHQYILYT